MNMKQLWLMRLQAVVIVGLFLAGTVGAAEEPRIELYSEGSYVTWAVDGFRVRVRSAVDHRAEEDPLLAGCRGR